MKQLKPGPVSRRSRRIALILIATVFGGCSKSPTEHDQAKAPKVVSVNVTTVTTDTQAQALIRTGTLRARRSVKLYSQEEGRIEALPYYEGDTVAAGEVVARLDDRLLAAESRKAEALHQEAVQNLQRIRRLAERKLIPADEQLRAETAAQVAAAEASLLKTRLGYATLSAPFAGVITERMAEPGDAVPRFAHVLTLVDPQSLIVDVGVSEMLLPALSTGTHLELSIDALGSTRFAGKIARIYPTVAADTRQGKIEIELTPVPNGAQAGQLARVYLAGEARARLTVPLNAMRQDPSGEFVFVIDAEQTAHRRSVHSGVALGEHIEILDGLQDGERIVTRGFIELTDGAPVQIIADANATP